MKERTPETVKQNTPEALEYVLKDVAQLFNAGLDAKGIRLEPGDLRDITTIVLSVIGHMTVTAFLTMAGLDDRIERLERLEKNGGRFE